MRFKRICLSLGVKRRAITRAVVKLKGNSRETRREREERVEREQIIYIQALKRIRTNQKDTCQTQKKER